MKELKLVHQKYGAGHNYWAVLFEDKTLCRFEGRGAKAKALSKFKDLQKIKFR